jgi:hypothetical protein
MGVVSLELPVQRRSHIQLRFDQTTEKSADHLSPRHLSHGIYCHPLLVRPPHSWGSFFFDSSDHWCRPKLQIFAALRFALCYLEKGEQAGIGKGRMADSRKIAKYNSSDGLA